MGLKFLETEKNLQRQYMDRSVNGAMAEKQNQLDYGVQIRFIDDLKETARLQKARSRPSKPSSYGVAVRVQGIAGQPFVVLNSGEKGESSYGVQIRSDNKYGGSLAGTQAAAPLPSDPSDAFPQYKKAPSSHSSDSEIPDNPYAASKDSQRYTQSISQYSTSDEDSKKACRTQTKEAGRGSSQKSNGTPSSQGERSRAREELWRSYSQGSLLQPDLEDDRERKHGERSALPASDATRSSSVTNLTSKARLNNDQPIDSVSGLRSVVKQQSTSVDIDTKPLSSVDSLINKFDVTGQPRGRTARRSRICPDERKRSQSLDSRVSYSDTVESRELPPAFWVDSQGLSDVGSLNRPYKRDCPELSISRSRMTQEWVNQGHKKPQIESRTQKLQAELQLKSTPDLLKDQTAGSSENMKELIYSILKDGTADSESSVKRKSSLVFEKLQPFMAGSSDSTRRVLSQKNELEKRVAELQQQLDQETKHIRMEPGKVQPWVGTHNLEIELEERVEECSRLKEAFQRKQKELNDISQELVELRMDKEHGETKMRALETEFLDLQEELAVLRKSSGNSAERDSLLKELQETQEELEEALSQKRKQEELLRQRERELTALKGALKEEVANHDKELDRVRQHYQKDMEQLQKSLDNVSQDQEGLESERQKINSVIRKLQRELEESSEEIGHWKELFQKNKEELRAAKQQLMQVKLEKEECEDELRELQERFSVVQMDHSKTGAVERAETEALRTERAQVQEDLKQLRLDWQRQEELLQQRERELGVLKGALKEEVSGRDREKERLQQSFQRDLQQLKKSYDETSRVKGVIEGEKEAAEQMRKVIECTLKETQEENDDLRRKVLNLEGQLKELMAFSEDLQDTEARLKEKIAKLEIERKRMEQSLGEATDQEQELAIVKRSLEGRLEEAQRNLNKLSVEYQELKDSYQEELRQKEQLKRMKSELEEQKRLLDKTIEKLTRELDHISDESRGSLFQLQSQLEEYKDKSRREIGESQKQMKERAVEVEQMQQSMTRLQEEVQRLKQALQDSQVEKENAVLDKELLSQRLQALGQEMESKKRSRDDWSRQVKGLEDKVKHLEVELDEEKSTGELLTDRINRSRDQMEQLRAELMQERASRQDLECDKIALERQSKELKNRLASAEGLPKQSANVSQLEARLQEMQDKLQAEEREKNTLLSAQRKLERKVKEVTIQLDDERLQVTDQKDQLNLRVKALKRQVDEAEEEIERLEGLRKKTLRELEEQQEVNEQLQSRIKTLEKDVWRKNTRVRPNSSLKDDDLSSDGEFDGSYDPSSITSLLTDSKLQTSSC
ncbi:cingulin isoform X2 [Microcaecilia unicolor]|uniref:Cingulin n=1 Tax=Microcaecilia unicolor TaxID=1415580 RepID=A0A6P7WI40_9AMPH|nr:cingulin isoform X2 [Microcaecilia unicolor]